MRLHRLSGHTMTYPRTDASAPFAVSTSKFCHLTMLPYGLVAGSETGPQGASLAHNDFLPIDRSMYERVCESGRAAAGPPSPGASNPSCTNIQPGPLDGGWPQDRSGSPVAVLAFRPVVPIGHI